MDAHQLDTRAAGNLLAYVAEQRAATGTVPTDQRITIERYRDELGDYRVCILSHFGGRVHAPWALAIQARLSMQAGFDVQVMWTDDGIALRWPDDSRTSGATEALLDMRSLVPEAEDVEDLVIAQLAHSALFAAHFRENAARALLMPRRRPGQRTPLWVQRMKARELLAAAREHPGFPIIIETYRSCLQDALDTPALVELCRAVARRDIAIDVVETRSPSPMARSLVFAYVASYLYNGDAPAAERRAHALALDRSLLRELLGQDDLRELLDPEVLTEVERQLQALTPERRTQHADAVHDLLRRLGDLGPSELEARSAGNATELLEPLVRSGRAALVQVAGDARYIATEDASLYRDGLGVELPPGVPTAMLQPREQPLTELLLRYARTHGPFSTRTVSERFGLADAQVAAALLALRQRGRLREGGFRPDGDGPEWCHDEVLRRLKRQTLARLRAQVAPVPVAALGRFSPAWHRIGRRDRGRAALEQALVQLEGLPLSFAELERVILPARVADYAPAMLDDLGAMGWLTWVGCGSLGARDGRVALYRRSHVAALLPEQLPEQDGLPALAGIADTSLHRTLLAHLQTRGASFFVALHDACAPASTEEVLSGLWDLVWAGAVTNDTFQPLRAFARTGTKARSSKSRGGRGRRRPRPVLGASVGRWSLTRELCARPPEPTERAHQRALSLLARHGLVCSEVVSVEWLRGGFSAVYPVLAAMEEAGKVRRGYFVDGLGGAQFAFPGAVERLRESAREREAGEGGLSAQVLSAIDPANPYGWLVPWPRRTSDAGESAARRVAGASLVLVGGRPVLYLHKGERKLLTLPAADEPACLRTAIAALDQVAARRRGRSLRIASIDGDKAISASLARHFLAAGYHREPNGLVRDLRAPTRD